MHKQGGNDLLHWENLCKGRLLVRFFFSSSVTTRLIQRKMAPLMIYSLFLSHEAIELSHCT